VPAFQAQPKVHPPVAHLEALFTALGVRFHVLNLIEMSALSHNVPPLGCRSGSRT
jgi:hypothetical protein